MTTQADRIEALKVEFDRLKGRQDYLDRMLQGHPETWAGIQHLIPHGTEVVIDKMVTEARQGALAMATVAKTLDALTAKDDAPAETVDPLKKMEDELAKKRASKAQ